ncbi:hypothetical protein VTH06DRAFT_3159 [Thermothelomyces fergusii]
MSLSA